MAVSFNNGLFGAVTPAAVKARPRQHMQGRPISDPGQNKKKQAGGGGKKKPSFNSNTPHATGGGTVTTTATALTPNQKKIVNLAMPDVNKYAKAPDSALKLHGDTVANFDPLQTKGQNMAVGAAGTQDALAKTGAATSTGLLAGGATDASKATPTGATMLEGRTDATKATSPTAKFLLGGDTISDTSSNAPTKFLMGDVLHPGSNPALQEHMDAATKPLYQNLMEQVMPGLRSGAQASGQYGSSRQGIAEGLAAGRTAQAAGATNADIANEGYKSGLGAMTNAYDAGLGAMGSAYGTGVNAETSAYNNGLDAMTKSLGLLPSTQGAQTAGAVTTSGVGDVKQNQVQRETDANNYKQIYNALVPLSKAQNLMQLSGSTPGGGTVTSGNGQTSLLQGALGGAGIGAGVGNSIAPGLGTAIGAAGGGGLGALLAALHL